MATSRGKNYSNEELKQLCNSVLHISECPFTGANQKAERFWERVTDHYAKNKPSGGGEGRVRKSLEGKWGDIKHDTAKFIGAYKQVEDLQISGSNEEDTLLKARELYRQKQGKNFTFESCFWILKESLRWSTPLDQMTSRKGSQGSKSKSRSRSDSELDLNESLPPTPLINLEDGPDVAQSGTEAADTRETDFPNRPIGNKRAKDEAKQKKMEQDFMKESLRVQGLMANATIARNEFDQGKGTLLKLLQIPTANLDPRVQEIVAQWTLAEADLVKRQLEELQPSQASAQQRSAPPQQQNFAADEVPFRDQDVYVPQMAEPVVYVPDMTDANIFMAEME